VGPTGRATPLYRAVADGVAGVRTGAGPRIRAVVVLTDGDDSGSDLNPAQFGRLVRGKGIPVFVVAVGDARCRAGDLAVIVRETNGTCYDTDFDNLDARLDGLFAALFGGD
jgi:Mg-chelatase subunit ChlD